MLIYDFLFPLFPIRIEKILKIYTQLPVDFFVKIAKISDSGLELNIPSSFGK